MYVPIKSWDLCTTNSLMLMKLHQQSRSIIGSFYFKFSVEIFEIFDCQYTSAFCQHMITLYTFYIAFNYTIFANIQH